MNTFTITINEDMTIEELLKVDAIIADAVETYRNALRGKLADLGFWSEDYVDGSNPEAEDLLAILNEDF